MLRRTGLLVGMILGVMFIAGEAAAQKVSVFTRKKPDYDHVYGAQVNLGFATYMMADVNDYRHATAHTVNEEDALFGIGGGLTFLYRSREDFRIAFGFNLLGQDRTYSSYTTGSLQEIEQTVSGSELYVQGNYLIPFTDVLTFHVGLGPSIVNGTLDRSVTTGQSFADATGRDFGFRGTIGAELIFAKRYGVNLDLGYRFARVNEISFENRNGVEETLFWGGGNRRLTLDFSGVIAELGIRAYFEPATDWIVF